MAQTKQQTLQTAFVYGLVSGIALGVSEVALALFMVWTMSSGLAIFIFRLALILLILSYLYASYQAARRSGNLLAGTLAGAFSGAFGVATVAWLSTLIAYLHLYLQPTSLLFGLLASGSSFFMLLPPLVRVMLTFAFYGAIVGTVGGYIGKRRSLN